MTMRRRVNGFGVRQFRRRATGLVLMEDTFTDTVGVALTAHQAERDGPWLSKLKSGAGLLIQSGNKAGAGTTSGETVVATQGVKDGFCEVVLSGYSAGAYNTSLIARWSSNSNVIQILPNGSGWTVKEYVSAAAVRTTAISTVASPVTLRLEFVGSTITAYVNGTVVDTWTCDPANNTAASVGVGFSTSNLTIQPRFDTFRAGLLGPANN